MHKGIGAAIAVISIIVAFVFMPQVMRTTDEMKVKAITEDHLVTTEALQTTASFALYDDLYDANLNQVIKIASSNNDDTPVAVLYNIVSRELTVDGLKENVQRTLQVTYNTDALEDKPGVGIFSGLMPLLMVGGIIAIVGGIVWHTLRSR